MDEEILGLRYAIVRLLGQGAMGAVYEARHTGTGRRVAVKVITADTLKHPRVLSRFAVEAQAAGRIESQHIAQILDSGTDERIQAPYMAMEYLLGEDVKQALARLGALPVDVALRITAQACLGLEAAHNAKIIHRDIKPANIFLAEFDGDNVVVKVLDFGVAKIVIEEEQNAQNAGITRTGTLLGSPLYMSPEQAKGAKTVDHRSDLWSLGIVLYQMLAGRTPLHHIDALGELILSICSEPPPPIRQFAPWVPVEVAQILDKTLARRPEDRFQSAGEMYRAIKALLAHGHAFDKAMVVSVSDAERAGLVAPLAASGFTQSGDRTSQTASRTSMPGLGADAGAPGSVQSMSVTGLGPGLGVSAPSSVQSMPVPELGPAAAPGSVQSMSVPGLGPAAAPGSVQSMSVPGLGAGAPGSVQTTSMPGLSLGTTAATLIDTPVPSTPGTPALPRRSKMPLVLAGAGAMVVVGVVLAVKLVGGHPSAPARTTAAAIATPSPVPSAPATVSTAADTGQPSPTAEPAPTASASPSASAIASAAPTASALPTASTSPTTEAAAKVPGAARSGQLGKPGSALSVKKAVQSRIGL